MISAVPVENVKEVWPHVMPLLERAIARHGHANLVNILDDILSRQSVLWISFTDDKTIIGCCVTKVLEYRSNSGDHRSLLLEWIAGEDFKDWMVDGLALLERYAIDNKCSFMEGQGRPGWEKIIKDSGWDKVSVRYERKLNATSES